MSETIIDVPVNDTDYDYDKFKVEQHINDAKDILETKFTNCNVSELNIADDGSGYSFRLNNK